MEVRPMSKKHVLIVDDEPHVTMTVACILETLGDTYVIDTTNTSREVLPKFEQTDYALLITDYKMPGMNGIDLVKAVQTISPETGIIMMTAFNNSAFAEAAGDIHLDGFLAKPFTVAQLRTMVTRILSSG